MKSFLLDDLPRKIAYALFVLGFWTAMILAPIWLGAQTVGVYDIVPTSDGQIMISAPDQEVAEVAVNVVALSVVWTAVILYHLETILAMILAGLLWATMASLERGLVFYGGTFALSIFSPGLSLLMWFGSLIAWARGYRI